MGLIDLIFTILCMLEVMFITYYLKKMIFLEHNNKKQKKITKILFLASGAALLTCFIVYVLTEILLQTSHTISESFHKIRGFIWDTSLPLYLILFAAAIIYSSVTGRKKRKWLGMLTALPLVGYFDTINALLDIPVKILNIIPENFQAFYYFLICSVILIPFILTLNEKTRPRFMRNLLYEIENRALSLPEEIGIFVLGIWLMLCTEVVQKRSDLPEWVNIYLNITNFVIGIIITAFIISGSYRRYYQNKNIDFQISLIRTMANLVESRDENTGGHIQRTAKYAELIARELKNENKFTDILTDKYIEEMVIAAPLHDVGKIHIPDSVLNKPGKLNKEEFDMMKSHSAAGGKIIDDVEKEVGEVDYLKIAKEMAKYHHERIDGKGYPYGLGNDEIPLSARILAVADVFDALTSKRCYKEAFSVDKAYSIIREDMGTHFDKDAAEAFFKVRDKVEEYLNETYAESAQE